MDQSHSTTDEPDNHDYMFDNEQYLADDSDDLLAALGSSDAPPENQAPIPNVSLEQAQNGAYYHPDNSNGGPSPPPTQVFPQNGTPNVVSEPQKPQQHHPLQHHQQQHHQPQQLQQQQQQHPQQASFQIQSQMEQQPESYPLNHVNTSLSNNGMQNGNQQAWAKSPISVPIHANLQNVHVNTSSTVTPASSENNQMTVPVAQTSDPASIINSQQATLHSNYASAVNGNNNNLKQLSEDVIELLDDDDEEKPASADGQLSKRPRVLSPASSIPPPPSQHVAAAASKDARYANMPQWMKSNAARPSRTPIIPGQTIPGYKDQYSSAQAAKKIAQMYGGHIDQNLIRKRKMSRHAPRYIKLPSKFVPSWPDLVPDPPTQVKPVENRAYELSLLNLEQFTITGLPVTNEGPPSSVAGLRKKIKEISKDYGKAIYEREGNDGEGRWQIPLGAYNNFFAYLNSQTNTRVIGIPNNQLQIASIGKARLSKGYPTMRKLVEAGVPRGLATALAPFQRGGVGFVIAKDGRALIADDMGLGKTIQAIASASVYHGEWPVLILTPSSARYHWANEFEQWLGADSNVNQEQTARINLGDDCEDEEHDDSPIDESKCMTLLDKSEIHVLTKSKEAVIPNKSTRVVICSYGLAPALVERGSLYAGLFKCAIVDESHMLKNMSTKRTKLLVPVLHATERCVLLSGTPALARPCELWPQLKILGTEKQGWWEDENEFVNNYVKKSSPARRAELHAMLTGTVMIRRMKTDILKSLPKKVREKAVVDVSTKEMRKKFHQYMELLREGKGVLGKLARQHSALAPEAVDTEYGQEYAAAVPEKRSFDIQKSQESVTEQAKQRYLEGKNRIHHTLMTTSHQLDESQKNELVFRLDSDLKTEIKVWADEQMLGLQQKQAKAEEGPTRQSVLNLMYSLTAKAKIPLLVDMIKKWLADPTKGKLCVFAHHLFMLDAIVNDVGLSNAPDSKMKYIRIDGSTQPMDRQNQIKAFQNDPSVRIAVLGITAAGVAVTLTASSTVWFTELFWTPALMIQAEDRCHRIGQNSRVQCLYFVAVGTMDELLWKMLEGKFQDLGEFVEGKEKLKLTVHRVYRGVRDLHTMFSRVDEDDSDDDAKGSGKEESDDDEMLELDVDLEKDIAELAKEELMEVREEADEDENEADSKPEADLVESTTPAQEEVHGRCEEEAIMLSDDEDCIEAEAVDPKKLKAVPPMPEPSKNVPLPRLAKFNRFGMLPNCKLYKLLFDGPSYGIQLRVFTGRLIVLRKIHLELMKPGVGDILVALNGQKIPAVHHLEHMLPYLKTALRNPPVELMFAEDNEFRDFAIPQILAEIKEAEEKDRADRMAYQNAKKQEASDDVIVLD